MPDLTIRDAWRVLLTAYPRWDVPEPTVALWSTMLADLEPSALLAGALDYAKSSQFPPTLAEWRDRSLTVAGRGKQHAMSASDGWDELRRHRQKFAQTRYNQNPYLPKWSCEAVRRSAEAVCWNDPDWTTEQLPTIRAQFERYFNALRGKQDAIDSANESAALLPNVMRSLASGDGPRRLMDGAP